jgi:hypothetical protein
MGRLIEEFFRRIPSPPNHPGRGIDLMLNGVADLFSQSFDFLSDLIQTFFDDHGDPF